MAVQTPLVQLLNQGNVQQTPSNVFENFQAGTKLQDQLKTTEQNREIGQQQLDVARETQRLQSLALGAQEVLPLIEAGDKEGVNKALDLRRQDLISRGLPTNNTDLFQKTFNENPEQAKQEAQAAIAGAESLGIFKSSRADTVQRSVALQDGTTIQVMRSGDRRVLSKEGQLLTGNAASRAIELANQREVQQEAGISGGRKRATEVEAKLSEFQNVGLEAADQIAGIKRSIEILKNVKTGGIDLAIQRGKQFFGIESANEAELSTNLGKNILAQLRPIFGAQFTEREGERLERIEAGFGKSVAGNRRLLDQALQVIDRAARRGIKSAEKTGNEFVADEIREALKFEFSFDEEIKQQEAQATTEEMDDLDAQIKALEAELAEGQ